MVDLESIVPQYVEELFSDMSNTKWNMGNLISRSRPAFSEGLNDF